MGFIQEHFSWEDSGATFPADGEVLYDTFSVLVQHLGQVVQRGDGVVTHPVQNNA